ncbi:stage V sporulation protein D [Clostridium grantii]|uniref:Stage V sporulation protein D (Sporulation-specific penicillin-binding protein) n=1 Tax=Clostridium grantii DSM 8605 TaxID=1121316 RepID=A0A1M5SHS8_9CLOT|nr:stage V sporulation protein D [Clostridium grantii]SHH38104.1 stage V sporulation protein D (sporulation-specific penicillin-binding protein) [Clostridium grantii DSM 8605]
MNKNQYSDKVIMKRRMLYTVSFLLLLFFGLFIRLGYIMLVKAKDYNPIAVQQWTEDVKIDAKRGQILDRNGNELAVSANVYRVDFDLNTLRKVQESKGLSNEDIAIKISNVIDIEKDKVLGILEKTLPGGLPMKSATLIRRIEKTEADNIRALGINGIIVSPDTARYYPNDNFLAHVLGHTNSDGEGLTGVELMYNSYLAGTPGILIAETDAKSQEIGNTISEYIPPIAGKNLILTIDEMIQHFAEKAADQALIDNKAKAVTIIISNPNNGEILAMVNKPDYDPNNPWIDGLSFEELQQSWRNRAVSDTYEPGSIFKVVTATAAMAEKVIDEDTYEIVCNGSTTIGKKIIHCWKRTGHGTQAFVDILRNSCNVGFMNLAEKLGAEALNKHIKLFGLGEKTGIDLPGEAKGIIKKTENITATDLATISFGQTNTLTPIQYVQVINAIANGGKLITPHVMKEIQWTDENNENQTIQYDNSNVRQVEDPVVMERLRGYLEEVITTGGGGKAYVEGYNIGGKTGTAQKVVDGKYAAQTYVASFGGMAPILPGKTPDLTVFISIDEPDPSNYYAGQIAAPVAKQIFVDVFNYLDMVNINSSKDELLSDVIVPEIRGSKKSEALSVLKESKLNYEISGDGEYVTDTTPKPGYTTKENSKIIVYTGSNNPVTNDIIVPNFNGLTEEAAIEILNDLGLKYEFNGEGLISHQSIEFKQKVSKNTLITFELEIIGD